MICNNFAVTAMMVPLVTHQADGSIFRELFYFFQSNLGGFTIHDTEKNRSELIHKSGSGRIPTLFRISKRFDMDVADTYRLDSFRERRFRKPFTPRLCTVSDIDKHFDTTGLKRRDKIFKIGLFITYSCKHSALLPGTDSHINSSLSPCELRLFLALR